MSRGQKGFSLVELLITSTLFALVLMAVMTSGSVFSQVLFEQNHRTLAASDANVVRTRILGDARVATSFLCADTATLSMDIGPGGSTVVQYWVEDERLVRWTLPPDQTSLVAEDVATLSCTALGADDVSVAIALGAAQNLFGLNVRISQR